jgi:hypothetical protein
VCFHEPKSGYACRNGKEKNEEKTLHARFDLAAYSSAKVQ